LQLFINVLQNAKAKKCEALMKYLKNNIGKSKVNFVIETNRKRIWIPANLWRNFFHNVK